MYTATEEIEPVWWDPVGAATAMSRSLTEWALALLSVPMVAAVTRCARPDESFGSILAEVLAERCGQTFGVVMDRWPHLLDAADEVSEVVGVVVEFINARGDELLAQALGLATEVGGTR